MQEKTSDQHRSSSADEALTLTPPRILSLEQALDFIDSDELLEVTPQSLRIRKKILDPTLRKRAAIRKNQMNQNAYPCFTQLPYTKSCSIRE